MSWSVVLVAAAGLASGLASMRAAFERGDLDEAARQGALAGPAIVERGLRSSDRATQLAAIAASRIVEDRAELLAPLAGVAAGPDRSVALPAAEAARAIARELAAAGRPDDLAPDDLASWQAAWGDLALRSDRGVEIRLAAADTAVALDPAGVGLDLGAALRDPDPAFRRGIASAPRLPVAPSGYAALGRAVAGDDDGLTALAAAQSLCLSLAAAASPTAILDAIGAPGVARLRGLTAAPPAGAGAATLRDAARCLAAARSPARSGGSPAAPVSPSPGRR